MDPPPYSSTPVNHGTTSRQPQALAIRWHPKITPFRLLVLLSTIILGTIKAVFTYKGESSNSTTLEWIAGVIFTLLLFVLEEWEMKESYPKHVQWFFTIDCMGIIWTTTRAFSLPRPVYRSDESNLVVTSLAAPSVPITGYRILVSAVVITLGSAKATLAYLGYNTTANTVDWTLGVLITSILYYVGLYESNTINLAPKFFLQNHSSPLVKIVTDVLIIIGVTLAMYVCIQWIHFSLNAVKNACGAFSTTTVAKRSSFILLHSLNVYVLAATLLSLTLSLCSSIAILALAFLAFRHQHPFMPAYILRRRTLSELYVQLTGPLSNAILRHFHHVRRTGIFFLRLFVYIFGMVVVLSLIFVFVGIFVILGEQNMVERGISTFLGNLVIQLTMVAYGAVFVVFLYYLFVRSLHHVFFQQDSLSST